MSRNTRLQQFLWDVQPVPGTMAALNAAHGRLRVIEGNSYDYQPDVIKRTRVRQSYTPLGDLVGKKALGFTIKSELNVPDNMTANLEEEPGLRAAGILPAASRRIARGAFTGGTPTRGATVTGQTSGAIGRLLVPPAWTAGTTNYILIAPVSGTFQNAETLSFGGGITCVAGSVASAWGWNGLPITPVDVLSSRLEEDGRAAEARDAAVSCGWEIENSGLGLWTWNIMGARENIGESPMTTGIAYDVGQPPLLQDARVTIGGVYTPVLAKIGFALNRKLAARGDANAAGDTGLAGYRATAPDPRFKLTIETPDEADMDFYAAFDASTKLALAGRVGSGMGRTFAFFADQWQPGVPSLQDNEGLRQFEIDGPCTHTTDNREFEFVWF